MSSRASRAKRGRVRSGGADACARVIVLTFVSVSFRVFPGWPLLCESECVCARVRVCVVRACISEVVTAAYHRAVRVLPDDARTHTQPSYTHVYFRAAASSAAPLARGKGGHGDGAHHVPHPDVRTQARKRAGALASLGAQQHRA